MTGWVSECCTADTVEAIHDYWHCPLHLNWAGTVEYCEREGTHLAVVTGASENAFVFALAGRGAYLEGSDSTTEGTWEWINGDPWSETF